MNIWTRGASILLSFFLAAPALAEEAEAAIETEIPREVYWQIFNFTIFVLLLFFLLRKKVVGYYREREETFRQALMKAESARKEAEEGKRAVEERIRKLEVTREKTLSEAKIEAHSMKERILAEAQALAEAVRSDAARAAQHEIDRAKNEIREELLRQSIESAKKHFSENIKEPDQRRLQDEFVEKIQAVGQ